VRPGESFVADGRRIHQHSCGEGRSRRVAIADLTRVCAVQQSVFVDHAEQRTAEVNADDIRSIAASSLPLPAASPLPLQFDETRQTWVISSPNPNLRIVGNWSGPLQGGMIGIGFGVSVNAIVSAGCSSVESPGFRRLFGRFPPFQDLGLPAGLLSQATYLGDRPPILPDYLDDAVSALVSIPAVQKMIVIAGMELTPPA
jgi:hypothetical protein